MSDQKILNATLRLERPDRPADDGGVGAITLTWTNTPFPTLMLDLIYQLTNYYLRMARPELAYVQEAVGTVVEELGDWHFIKRPGQSAAAPEQPADGLDGIGGTLVTVDRIQVGFKRPEQLDQPPTEMVLSLKFRHRPEPLNIYFGDPRVVNGLIAQLEMYRRLIWPQPGDKTTAFGPVA